MIAALLVAGLVLAGAAVFGARVVPAAGSPAARITLVGLGVAFLLAAGTSAFLARVQAPAQLAATAQPAQSPRTQRVMVVGDDTPAGAIRRSDPVFEAALAAFETELRRAGFAIADGRTISTVDEALEGARRPDSEIVQLAHRTQREPLDAVVLFSLFVRLQFAIAAQTASNRGTATLLRASDAGNLGAFEAVSPSQWTLPYDCGRPCLVQTTGVEAPLVAETIAGQLVTALDNAR